MREAAERRGEETAALVDRMRAAGAEPGTSAAARRFQQRLERVLREALADLEDGDRTGT